MNIKIVVETEAEMRGFAEHIADIVCKGDWVSLIGELGVGKTVFAKAFIAKLGFHGEVSSPSYALVNSYDPPSVKFHISHADLYRIERDSEYQELGLYDVLDYGVVLVEWADKYPLPLPHNRFVVNIVKTSDGKREIMLGIYGDGVARWT